jgi:hypothetical protein
MCWKVVGNSILIAKWNNIVQLFYFWWFSWWWSCRWDETMTLNCSHQQAYCSRPRWYISMWTTVDDVDWGKLVIRPQEHSLLILPAEPSCSKSGESGRRKWWILSTKYFLHTCKVVLDAVKCYNVWPPSVILLRRNVFSGFLSPLEIHSLGRFWTHKPLVQWKAH